MSTTPADNILALLTTRSPVALRGFAYLQFNWFRLAGLVLAKSLLALQCSYSSEDFLRERNTIKHSSRVQGRPIDGTLGPLDCPRSLLESSERQICEYVCSRRNLECIIALFIVDFLRSRISRSIKHQNYLSRL